jgi:hypothetical protein
VQSAQRDLLRVMCAAAQRHWIATALARSAKRGRRFQFPSCKIHCAARAERSERRLAISDRTKTVSTKRERREREDAAGV